MSDQPPRDPDAEPSDVGRRSFFRHLGRNAVRAAGNAAGTVDVVRRGSVAAAGGLLGFGLDPDESLDEPPAPVAARALPARTEPVDPDAGRGFIALEYRSAYRLQGDLLLIVDQRRLPYELVDVACSDGLQVSRAIADGAVRGGPVLAQVAAYGLYLTARLVRGLTPEQRDSAIDGAVYALRAARPTSRPLAYAVDRMATRWRTFRSRPSPGDPAEVMRTEPGALRTEADAIATEAQLDHAKLARRAAASIDVPDGRPTGLLVHGNAGVLAGGMVGTALGVVQQLVTDGRDVHVWVTESRPGRDGERLATLELARLDAPFTLIADAEAGRVLSTGNVDAVLFGAEHIARNGDTANTAGSFPIAAAAAALGVRVLVCAPSCTIDPNCIDGRGIPVDAEGDGQPLDIIPATFITAIHTENGPIDPAQPDQVRAAYERSAQRRLPHGTGPPSAAVADAPITSGEPAAATTAHAPNSTAG